jgi:DNA mismatch repair ATPase MutS
MLQSGVDYKSFGIDVARLAGIPETVEIRARELLTPLEEKADFHMDFNHTHVASSE